MVTGEGRNNVDGFRKKSSEKTKPVEVSIGW